MHLDPSRTQSLKNPSALVLHNYASDVVFLLRVEVLEERNLRRNFWFLETILGFHCVSSENYLQAF